MTLLLALALLPMDGSPATVPPRFEARTEVVWVDVVVTADAHPVRGLTASDFDLRDDGVRQEVHSLSSWPLPIDATLVLDTSGSVSGERIRRLRAAARAFAGQLGEEDRIGLLAFRHTLEYLPPDVGRQQVLAALDAAQAAGGTALYDAIYAALALSESGTRRPVLVVFTDGADRLSWLRPEQLLEAARRSPAVVYVVDASRRECTMPGGSRPKPVLLQLTHDTGGRCWDAGAGDLEAAFQAVAEELRSRYLLRYEPRGVSRPGWHELKLGLRRAHGEVRARRGYWVERPPD